MKRNLILMGILGLLFMGGVFIYDFSDEMDEKLTSHKWYIVENNKTYVMSFKDNYFAYTDINGKVIDEWVSTNEVHELKNLPEGTYTLEETIAPKGYVLSTEKITFKVTRDGKTSKVVM